jgi:hypothetical protein
MVNGEEAVSKGMDNFLNKILFRISPNFTKVLNFRKVIKRRTKYCFG